MRRSAGQRVQNRCEAITSRKQRTRACAPAFVRQTTRGQTVLRRAISVSTISFFNSGTHDPQLPPAFTQDVISAAVFRPLSTIALQIVLRPTPKHEHTVGPVSSPLPIGWPRSRL